VLPQADLFLARLHPEASLECWPAEMAVRERATANVGDAFLEQMP
jgi:hypothetical protein